MTSERTAFAYDETRLFVRVSGPDTAAVTVVLAHGWTLDHQLWDDVAARLVDGARDVRVVQYDHRGHGRSERGPIGSCTLEQLADDLAAVIAAHAPDGPLILAGHSMGGMTIMALAERHPDLVRARVAGAAFVATSAGNLMRALQRLPGFERVRLALADRDARPPTRLGLRIGLFGASPRRTDLDRTIAQMTRADPGARAEFGESILCHDRAGELQLFADMPVVVLSGTRDRLTPAAHGRVLAAAIPGATFVRYPRAGHQLPYERRDDVAAELARLVRSVPASEAITSH